MDKALIDALHDNRKFCRYLDLPLQHAAPGILKRMNRRGDIDQTEALLLYARQKGFALRTTMIVGFPGESEQDFEQLMAFCERVRFDRLGAFAFSPEEDTKAYGMPDQVPEDTKQKRLDTLMALQKTISLQRNRERIGSLEQVLVTGVRGKTALGRSPWEAPDSDGLIRFRQDGSLREGQFVKVRITGATDYDLSGELQGEGESV